MNDKYMYSDCRFSEMGEAIEDLNECDIKSETCDAGGLAITMNPQNQVFMVDGSCESHSLIIGGTGSRKTRGILAPTVISLACSGENIICHDPKSEVYKLTSALLHRKGYKIYALNLRNPRTGSQYNPLREAYLKHSEGNDSAAYSIILEFATPLFMNIHSKNDPYWTHSGILYFCGLAALLMNLCESAEQYTLNGIYDLHLEGHMKPRTYLDYVGKRENGREAERLLSGIIDLPNDTRNCVMGIFSSVITKFIYNDQLIDMLSESSFSVDDFKKHKTALFIINRDETSAYNMIVSAIISQFYSGLVEHAEKMGGELPIRTNFILDEYQALAPGLQDVGNWVSASRSRRIRLFIAVQSLKQLEYARESDTSLGSVILDNMTNIVYLYSPSLETIETISKMCGEEYDSVRKREVCLVSKNTLRYLQKKDNYSEALFISGRKHPFFSKIYDISAFHAEREIPLETRRKKAAKSIDYDTLRKKIVDEIVESVKLSTNGDKEPSTSEIKEMSVELDKLIAIDEERERKMLLRKIDKKLEELEKEEQN